jgi:hypothetical protein
MGCDIHAYAEYKSANNDNWQTFGGEIVLDRNYKAFGQLAGVRSAGNPVFPVRGLPHDLACRSSNDWWVFITEDGDLEQGYASPEKAAYWVANCRCTYRQDSQGKNSWVSHPDWHTPSWLTGDEWRKAIEGLEFGHEYRAVGAALSSLEQEGHETRVVFWFDN